MILVSYFTQNNSGKVPLVEGEIIFDERISPFSGATVYLRLEDVSLLDAPSRVISEEVIKNVSYRGDAQNRLRFTLEGEIPDQKAHYAVRVHVDLDGDGKVSSGDYITMESYPVLTFGHPNHVSVRIREVK